MDRFSTIGRAEQPRLFFLLDARCVDTRLEQLKMPTGTVKWFNSTKGYAPSSPRARQGCFCAYLGGGARWPQ